MSKFKVWLIHKLGGHVHQKIILNKVVRYDHDAIQRLQTCIKLSVREEEELGDNLHSYIEEKLAMAIARAINETHAYDIHKQQVYDEFDTANIYTATISCVKEPYEIV